MTISKYLKPLPLPLKMKRKKFCRIIHRLCIIVAFLSIPLLILATNNRNWFYFDPDVSKHETHIDDCYRLIEHNRIHGPKTSSWQDSDRYFYRGIRIWKGLKLKEIKKRQNLSRYISQMMAIPLFWIVYYFGSTLLSIIIINSLRGVFEIGTINKEI